MIRMKPFNVWPWLLIALGLVFTGLMGWSIMRASTRVSAIADRDYYTHGLHYGHDQQAQQRAEELGWRFSLDYRDDVLDVLLTSAGGDPVSGAEGEILFDGGGDRKLRQSLTEVATGRYRAELPDGMVGFKEVHLILSRDGARLERRLLLNRAG